MPKAKGQTSAGAATHIALLRAINVGGNKKVAMADLRDFMAELGFRDVRSLLQTGNLVFRGKGQTSAELERTLENEARKRLHLDTAGPVSRLDLDQHNVARTDTDNVPLAKAGGRAGAAVAKRFEQAHRTVFVSCAFGFGVHLNLKGAASGSVQSAQ